MLLIVGWSFVPISPDRLSGSVRAWFNLGHLPAYALLAALTLQLLRCRGARLGYRCAVLASGAATIAASGLIEYLQPYVGRSRDLADFGMNVGGVVLALLLVSCVRQRTRRPAGKS